MSPLFSVVIPTHNRKELLEQTLSSVWQQGFPSYEVIVVDDGSSDGTADFLRSIRKPIEVVYQSNRGPGAARNAGASRARGQYLAFLDSDDMWFPWTLDAYDALITRHESPSFLAGGPFRFKFESQLEGAKNTPPAGIWFHDYLASGDEWRWWGVSSFVIKREAFSQVGGFTERHINGEDADLALRLGEAPGFVQVTSPLTFAYREHLQSAHTDIGRTLDGIWHLIHKESEGRYPGGAARAMERLCIISRHVRPASLHCINSGEFAAGLRLYRASIRWHVAMGRWKYLAGFPIAALAAAANIRLASHQNG